MLCEWAGDGPWRAALPGGWGTKVTSDRDCRERRSRNATCRASCAAFTNRRALHFIEHDDVKESDRAGTLPDHEDLVDHHQLDHDPTVPLGKLSIHVGTCNPPARTDLLR